MVIPLWWWWWCCLAKASELDDTASTIASAIVLVLMFPPHKTPEMALFYEEVTDDLREGSFDGRQLWALRPSQFASTISSSTVTLQFLKWAT
jgi:hypothetical protein